MGSRYLTGLADVLRAAGLTVVEVDHMDGGRIVEGPAWKSRARGSGGFDGDRPWAICWHHTASEPGTSAESNVSYATFTSDNEPICNLYLHPPTGVWYCCAAGATNTEGKGGPYVTSRGTIPLDAGNTYFVGIEAGNSGVGEPWQQIGIDSYFAGTIALVEYLGISLNDVATHADYTTRKIDPATAAAVLGPWRPAAINSSGTWSVADIRSEVVARATAPTPPTPTPPPEDDMRAGPFLIQATGKDGTPAGRVYATDGNMMTLRWLETPEALDGYRWQATQVFKWSAPELVPGAPIQGIDTIAAFGVVIE